jgi:hypothetical protein
MCVVCGAPPCQALVEVDLSLKALVFFAAVACRCAAALLRTWPLEQPLRCVASLEYLQGYSSNCGDPSHGSWTPTGSHVNSNNHHLSHAVDVMCYCGYASPWVGHVWALDATHVCVTQLTMTCDHDCYTGAGALSVVHPAAPQGRLAAITLHCHHGPC